jgi:double-stranded RNA-binding protein Staufen
LLVLLGCFSAQVHKANVTPTVELNALAMKRGEPTSYTLLEPLPAAFPPVYHRPLPFQRFHYNKQPVYPMAPPPVFYVTLKVGEREFSGQGKTAQTAKHDAAAKALLELKALPMPESSSQENGQVQAFFVNRKIPLRLPGKNGEIKNMGKKID